MHLPIKPFPCYLCGKGPDHTTHVIGSCEITTAARQTFGRMIGIPLQNSPHAYGLALSPAPDAPIHATQRLANATVVFNWAVWHQRVTHFRYQPLLRTHSLADLPSASQRIAEDAVVAWNRFMPPNWRTTIAYLPPDPALLDSSKFGSADKRTPAQERAAREYGTTQLVLVPDTAYIAFTDGASKGNSNKRRSPQRRPCRSSPLRRR